MAILDAQGHPIAQTPAPPPDNKNEKLHALAKRIGAIAAVLGAIAAVIVAVDKIAGSVSNSPPIAATQAPAITIQITGDSLRNSAAEIGRAQSEPSANARTEDKLAAEDLRAAADQLNAVVTIVGNSEATPMWVRFAIKEIGQRETLGSQHNPRVLEYIRSANAELLSLGDEIPWNSAFIHWSFAQADIIGAGTSPIAWAKWGSPLEAPRLGAVVIYSRTTQGNPPLAGIFLAETEDFVLCLGGNVQNAVRVTSVARDRIVGYRWPIN